MPFVTNSADKSNSAGADDVQDVDVASSALPTGAATSANQDTQITSASALLTELQLKADLTERQHATLYDADGNAIKSNTDANGEHHLAVASIQDIITSTKNLSTDNLASGATFTGLAEETFGITTIQVFMLANQDCTVYVDQGVDGLSWDITDSVTVYADNTFAQSFTSVAPYFRIRVTNISDSATTSFVVAAGMTPILSILPRKLSDDGRLETESTLTGRENSDRHVWVNPTNELATSAVYRMVGTSFDGTTLDPNFWTDRSLRGGTVTQEGGEIELDTNTTANGLALYQSVRKARFVAGSAQLFQGAVKWVTEGTANNTRRVGAYTLDASLDVVDGFFFQLSGTTFSIGYARAGAQTLVSSGSFNGNIGVNFTPLTTQYYTVAIEFTPMGAFWYVNKRLLHRINMAHMSNTNTLPITIENENTGGITTDIVFDSVGLYIARQGELLTNPISKYMTTGTHVLKYGAGVLKKIIVGDNVSGSVTVYDNTTATGTLITVLDTAVGSSPLGSMDYNIPFSNGLTIVIVGTNKITVVYE